MTTLTDAERAAMREVATDALDRGAWYHAHGYEMEPPTCEETLAADVLSLLALYEASQAALTGALAELAAARAEIERLRYDLQQASDAAFDEAMRQ